MSGRVAGTVRACAWLIVRCALWQDWRLTKKLRVLTEWRNQRDR